MQDQKIVWFLRPLWVWIGMLSVGPLALPFLWFSPAFSKGLKIALSCALILFSYWTTLAMLHFWDLVQDPEKIHKLLEPYLSEEQKELLNSFLVSP
jgi:hypothetical protein